MAEQLISTAVHHTLPESYVRAVAERPRLDEVVPDADFPVVDLADPDRAAVVSQIGAACSSHGFFQVLNHGLPVEVMLAAMSVAHDFFRLSPEEKAKLYSDDPAKKMRLSTSFNVRKETVHNWRDYLRLHCHPLEQFVPEWPANPPPFRDVMSTYCKEVRELGFRLYAAISESLGREQDYIKKVLGEQEQHMAVNFYPKCPSPELTYGLPAHTDPNALTILMMDEQVAGLQVLKEGRWIAVNPRPNALVINLGDQLQALSNGRYKSVCHRAVVNSDRPSMSIASFLCPCNSVKLGPAEKLIGDGSPAVYRNYAYDEYYKKFWSRNLGQEDADFLSRRSTTIALCDSDETGGGETERLLIPTPPPLPRFPRVAPRGAGATSAPGAPGMVATFPVEIEIGKAAASGAAKGCCEAMTEALCKLLCGDSPASNCF